MNMIKKIIKNSINNSDTKRNNNFTETNENRR
jgi:hypothetical protein